MERLRINSSPDELSSSSGDGSAATASGTTGRYLMLFSEGATDQGLKALTKTAGIKAVNTADFKESAFNFGDLGDADALVFNEIGVAVVSGEPSQMQSLAAAAGEGQAILAMEPERVVYALAAPAPAPIGLPLAPERGAATDIAYLRGYRDAVDNLVNNLLQGGATGLRQVTEEEVFAEVTTTWGLQATKANLSRFTGKGIKVAILDTGFDLHHPDFQGRVITTQSFIPGQLVQDGHGHGTHVTGTACGPRTPAIQPRYGVASQSHIFIGKVLSNAGSGADAGILAGINWAVANKVAVVSMSLGGAVQPGQPFSLVFETVSNRAMRLGTLIIAAAGNESNRPAGQLSPVGHPANCPSILAVGAVDSGLHIAPFSNRGLNPNGGKVDLVGPGVAVYSSWPLPRRYNTISGTSMATPHVSGIAALFAEANPTARGVALAHLLLTRTRPLTIPAIDEGAGLVQSP